RVFYFARQKGDVVPAIVGPQRSEHRGCETRNTAGRDRHAFARASAVTQSEITPLATAIKECTETETDQQYDLHARQHTRNAATDANGRAVDERRHDDCAERYQLQATDR